MMKRRFDPSTVCEVYSGPKNLRRFIIFKKSSSIFIYLYFVTTEGSGFPKTSEKRFHYL